MHLFGRFQCNQKFSLEKRTMAANAVIGERYYDSHVQNLLRNFLHDHLCLRTALLYCNQDSYFSVVHFRLGVTTVKGHWSSKSLIRFTSTLQFQKSQKPDLNLKKYLGVSPVQTRKIEWHILFTQWEVCTNLWIVCVISRDKLMLLCFHLVTFTGFGLLFGYIREGKTRWNSHRRAMPSGNHSGLPFQVPPQDPRVQTPQQIPVIRQPKNLRVPSQRSSDSIAVGKCIQGGYWECGGTRSLSKVPARQEEIGKARGKRTRGGGRYSQGFARRFVGSD